MRHLFKHRSAHFYGFACIFFGTVCFAAKGIVIKLAYGYGITATPLLTLRMLLALPFYAAIALWLQSQNQTPLSLGDRWKIIGLGLLSYYVSSLLDFMGLQYISAGLERLILYLYPTLVLLMLAFHQHKSISQREKLTLGIAYAGILLVFCQDLRLTHDWSLTLLGAALVALSTVSFAVFVVLAGNSITKVGSTRFTAYAMLSACGGVVLHSLLLGGFADIVQPLPVYSLALVLAVFCTVIPSFLMNKGISLIGSDRAAVFGIFGPVVTLFLGALFLDEKITLIQLIGAALIISGVAFATQKNN